MDDYFKDIANTRDAVERMFKPYKEIIKGIEEQSKEHAKIMQAASNHAQPAIIASEIINEKIELIGKTNKDLAEQINNIIKPIQNINSSPDDLIISNFINSYNSTKELIDNFEEYDNIESDNRLSDINKAKEKTGKLPDLQYEIENLDENEKKELKEFIKEVYPDLNKDKSKLDSLNSKLKFLVITSNIPDALAKHYEFIKDIILCLIN